MINKIAEAVIPFIIVLLLLLLNSLNIRSDRGVSLSFGLCVLQDTIHQTEIPQNNANWTVAEESSG